MGKGQGRTALKTGCACLLGLAALSGCSGGRAPDTVANVNTSATSANRLPTVPAGQTPMPEVTLTGNLAERTAQKRNSEVPQSGPPPTPGHFDAPEDSTITTTMNKSGQVVESRVFKTHRQLAKVDSTWIGPQERQIKIYLRDGNNHEVTTDKLPSLRAASSTDILALIGVHVPQPSAAERGETGLKKRQ
jgi:hypothetical protein